MYNRGKTLNYFLIDINSFRQLNLNVNDTICEKDSISFKGKLNVIIQ
jgi:hypothetical protein